MCDESGLSVAVLLTVGLVLAGTAAITRGLTGRA